MTVLMKAADLRSGYVFCVDGSGAPRGVVSGLKGLYAQGGFRAFFLGNGVNCLKVRRLC